MKKLIHSEILQERLTTDQAKDVDRLPISIMLSNIRSLYNVGSMFRTCDAALVSELILCGFTPYPPRSEIEKTALGAVDTVPWRYFKTEHEAIEYLKQKKIKVIALEITDKKRSYTSLAPDDYPLCLVLGNELTGIDQEILELCDEAIEIEMHGVKHSLNVSVAGGIAIFEAVRKWKEITN
jgi:23S rRNA (guanosine2251-2'-O)-methyltransferase